MTQEQKDLLLKDLCARLPYGVKVQAFDYYDDIETVETLYQIDSDGYTSTIECDTLKHTHKPYLFPLSSITEEQMEKLKGLCNMFNPDYYYPYAYWGIGVLYRHIHDDNYKLDFKTDVIDWFHKNHIDYRGLIKKGLAIDATGLNIY